MPRGYMLPIPLPFGGVRTDIPPARARPTQKMRLRWLWMQAFGDDASSTKAREPVAVRLQPRRAVVVADGESQVGAAFR